MNEDKRNTNTEQDGSLASPTGEIKADDMKVSEESLKAAEKLDKSSNTQNNSNKVIAMLVSITLVGLAIYHIYVGLFGARSAMELRAGHWLVMSSMAFLVYPFSKKSKGKTSVFDWLWVAAAVAASGYILLNWMRIAMRAGVVDQIDIVFGIIAVIVVLESARRAMGLMLPMVAGVFLLYLFFGQHIPGIMGHRGFSITRIFAFMYTGTEGIFGLAIDVSAKYIALFVLFGSLLERFGGGQLFVDLAYALTGKTRGGPAKACVVGTVLVGTMTGSAVANVVTTGPFTIPLMKKNGYSATTAGAIEAAASTGGQLSPPIMGAAAFLMAEVTGIPYSAIVIAALIPALLYFFSIFVVVDLEAAKNKIKIPEDQAQSIWKILKERGYLLVPLFVLIFFIIRGNSPFLSASYAILSVLVVDVIFSKERLQMPKKFFQAADKGMRSMISIACACACAGIIVATISLTGLGAKFSSMMLAVSGDNIMIALIMTMFASLIVGLGMPTTVVYMITATMAAPALVRMGVPMMQAHLFVFYFGCISTITPPIALSSFAGAALAGAEPNKVAVTGFRFAIIAFIVPFMFVYRPALTAEGDALLIATTLLTALIGVVFVAVATQGWLLERASGLERILALTSGLLLIAPGLLVNIVGFAIAAGIVLVQMRKRQTMRALPA